MGVKLASVTGSALLERGPAPRQNPAYSQWHDVLRKDGGQIVRKDYRAGQKHDLAKLPYLFKRIRHLLRVFYDFLVGLRPHPDLVFCDWEQMFDVGLTLHEVGLCLQLDPPRLRAAMAAGGRELESFLLDDDLDIGDFRTAAIETERRVAADAESEDADRMAASDIEGMADKDIAAHVLAWFFGDISVAFIMNENTGSDADEKRWAGKALTRLVHWSTSATLRTTLGDSLTDAMRPIYWSKPLLIKFSQAGGLGALFGDWANSTCRDMCEEVLENLPDAVWENQTPASLLAVTRELQTKLHQETFDLASTPIFVNAFFNIYRLYGLAPFHKAARREKYDTPVVFYYVAHCIKRDTLQMRTRKDWARLLGEYVAMPRSTEQRYRWANYTISGRWDCLEFHGCCASECPERRALEALREKRVRGVRDPSVEARLDAWGAKPKACAACGDTSYCSAACQREHWPTHKPDCLKKRKSAKRT
ncbi:hypothetical protein B0H14DRAFT_3467446 [Mycena olivaceomarginata]|nr:hypothetical protein B0H14DRAFT_3467446 [Mycena olivaceomarginata]